MAEIDAIEAADKSQPESSQAPATKSPVPGALLVLALGVGFLSLGSWTFLKQRALQHWPSTEATVVKIQTGPVPGKIDDHTTHVRYTYVVNGTTYTSERLNPDAREYRKEVIEQSAGPLFWNAKIRCWYNPASPDEAYLVNVGVSTNVVVLSAFGVAAILLCLYVLAFRRNQLLRRAEG